MEKLSLDLKGITKNQEVKLLESSDAILNVEVKTTKIEGKFSLKLNLRLIYRNGRSFTGSSAFDDTALERGAGAAVNYL